MKIILLAAIMFLSINAIGQTIKMDSASKYTISDKLFLSEAFKPTNFVSVTSFKVVNSDHQTVIEYKLKEKLVQIISTPAEYLFLQADTIKVGSEIFIKLISKPSN